MADADDLLRSALVKQKSVATAASSELLKKTAGELYVQLGALSLDPGAARRGSEGGYRSSVDPDDLQRGPAASELGRRIFLRWSHALHDFTCKPREEDKALQEQIIQAIFDKNGGGVALLAAGLVTAFGVSPAISAVVAALIVKLIVAPAMDELCKVWDEQIAGQGAP